MIEDYFDEPVADDLDIDEVAARLDAAHARVQSKPIKSLAQQPLFQTLFQQSVNPDDVILNDFAHHVSGPLSVHFGMKSAKGGAFFQKKLAEYEAQQKGRDPHDYEHDQTLRAHLINGMLAALHIARHLAAWGGHKMRHWDDDTERLFIAGYMLHDFLKIPSAQETLKQAGFQTYFEMSAPSERQIPVLEDIFCEWCRRLGLDAFLEPVGGAAYVVQDLIYIACNTQQFSGTAHAPRLLPDTRTPSNVFMLATEVSHLADLLAYVAKTPRKVVAHPTIRQVIIELGRAPQTPNGVVGKLVYHHVAENRGVLLNFIHDAALEALTIDNRRVPLLYAPSGVVYLEHYNAPPMPAPEVLIARIVEHIRHTASTRIIQTGKGAKRGNVGVQVDDSYNDFFDLREIVRRSPHIIEKYVRSNKSPDRLAPVRESRWLADDLMPSVPTDPKDARCDQIAEWAGFLETQFRDRFDTFDLTSWLLPRLGIEDLHPAFDALRYHPEARKGGIKYWWFWAGAHALNRQPGMSPEAVVEGMQAIADELAAALPDDLPPSAQVNGETWRELETYISRVLTLGGTKSAVSAQGDELARYTRAKAGRGGSVCAICGGDYTTRKPSETAVAFQPGVYTGRIKIGAAENTRRLCSICALEQLLRQLFVDNLDTGSKVEEQRVRYLSFYPSYFFTPETLRFIRRVYGLIKDVRISDKDLRRALNEHDLHDSTFWQRLEPFLMRTEVEEPSKRVVRYSSEAPTTYLSIGFRGFNKPADSESWILPAWLALVLSVCLDVKVVASESGVPLLLEADELPETIWFDGAHPAVLDLLGGSRLNIDQVMDALVRLTAGYLIHLDTEYDPPKENWHRLPPIAHSLMESPLYVFHYLKKQERDDHPISADQVQRYVAYAESIFNSQPRGDVLMSYAKELVDLYRGFYRAKTITNTNSILRPLNVVADALLIADTRLFPDAESLTEVAYGELYRFMDRVASGQADGRFPKGISPQEREKAMRAFCQKFVNDVFIGVFNGDVAALRGKQLNLLRSACEVLYRKSHQDEWESYRQETDESDDEN
jgi:CRISPR-associated protein Csc3